MADRQAIEVGTTKQHRIFLCHNSKDKPAVERIADALELDYGLLYFLDVTSIPPGEAFLPAIEKALAECTGCAIFLGGTGWGPTHYWEAERALTRQRSDLDFRVIPVALPDITPSDMEKLGSGSFFREVNWADFREGFDNARAIERLRAVLTGQTLPTDRGPDRLTPYQIRRDAARWDKSKRVDRSILYRGRQLEEANRLADVSKDVLAVPTVTAFLVEAERQQRLWWRNLAIASGMAAVAILVAAIVAVVQYNISEFRRQQSTSRQLAALAGAADGADRSLLLAVAAYRTSPTAEAMRSLIEQDSKWRALDRIIYSPAPVDALATVTGGIVLAGLDTGQLMTWDVASGKLLGTLDDPGHHGRVTALYVVPKTHLVWIGREDGEIDTAILNDTGRPAGVQVVVAPPAPAPRQDRRIITLSGSTAAGVVAGGTADGRVVIFDAASRQLKWQIGHDLKQQFRALAFSPDGKQLFAGDQNGVLSVIDPTTGIVVTTLPGFDDSIALIEPLAQGRVGVATGNGMLSVLQSADNRRYDFVSSANLPSLISAAAYDPGRQWLSLGDVEGNVHLRHSTASEAGFGSLTVHRSVVRALAFDGDGRLIAAADDGAIAVLSFERHAGGTENLAPVPLAPTVIRATAKQVAVAGTETGVAGVWTLGGGQSTKTIDLLAETRRVEQSLLGPPADYEPLEPGWQDLSAIEVNGLTLDPQAMAVSWTTQGGGVLWSSLPTKKAGATLLGRFGTTPGPMAIDGDGERVAVVSPADIVTVFDATSSAAPVRFLAAGEVRSLALNRDGSLLALGLEDGRVQFHRAGALQDQPPAQISADPIDGMAFTPDEQSVVAYGVVSGDRPLFFIPLSDPTNVRRLQIRLAGGAPSSLAVGGRSGYIAEGDLNGQVLLWRLSDQAFVASIATGGGNVSAIGFEKGTDRLIVATADKGIVSYDLDAAKLIVDSCTRAGRDLLAIEWAELLPGDVQTPMCSGME
ncbi:TIR domain-containing protein [Mesorhizobium sp.]|uniref:toll/interleukin-1 receptor domain-containing protein n=1 Tax=Mesorhizobium sp. TaxID=1871066 RepID=UPI000FE6372E|nr:TIR domain-containing protein [Mesorhizobium sp.]RWE79584.1 MAG: TIR domain-containing protein [Mesorhizobium sp.]